MATSKKKSKKTRKTESGKTQNVLGKGLSALISSQDVDLSSKGFLPNLPVDQVSPNPHQPRMAIKTEDLVEIADSVRENGVIQPLIVSKRGDKDYVLIAGERRLRAAQLAGLETVPVVVKDVSPRQMLELAVIENVQRKDLNPIEEALAFSQLKSKFGLAHGEIAKKVGLSRVAVVNKIRLLKLPEKVKQLVLDNAISEGHARALLGIKDNDSLMAAADVVLKKGLSVHDTEELVRKIVLGIEKRTGRPRRLDPRGLEIEKRLTQRIGVPLKITKLKGGGKIVIRYRSDNELEKIYSNIVNAV
ncbi:ParB/RepB/Spo0J family partition protein [Candidatus Dojkabacteria bacterium]|nr:ParB/RepB/Spo0J family partition protein [Candidatus Dojkabacteria bacterium]